MTRFDGDSQRKAEAHLLVEVVAQGFEAIRGRCLAGCGNIGSHLRLFQRPEVRAAITQTRRFQDIEEEKERRKSAGSCAPELPDELVEEREVILEVLIFGDDVLLGDLELLDGVLGFLCSLNGIIGLGLGSLELLLHGAIWVCLKQECSSTSLS